MVSLIQAADPLVALGRRLRRARIERNDTMAVFAQRIGVSVPTLRAMERGSPAVQIGAWTNALWALDRLDELERVLAPGESLLDRARGGGAHERKRAYTRRRPAG